MNQFKCITDVYFIIFSLGKSSSLATVLTVLGFGCCILNIMSEIYNSFITNKKEIFTVYFLPLHLMKFQAAELYFHSENIYETQEDIIL